MWHGGFCREWLSLVDVCVLSPPHEMASVQWPGKDELSIQNQIFRIHAQTQKQTHLSRPSTGLNLKPCNLT